MIAMLGASFKNTSFTDLDTLARAVPRLSESLMATPHSQVHGIVTVSTCNRVEIYVDTPSPVETITAIQGILTERTNIIASTLLGEENETVQHLFAVTCGLDSMIPGEREILGQVRRSLAEAQDAHWLTPRLTRVFERSLSTAKDIMTVTRLGETGRSLIDTALTLTLDNDDETKPSALIIGTGAYAKVTHAALTRQGFHDIRVYSASGRAGHFTENHAGQIVPVANLTGALCDVSMVIECSGQGAIDWAKVLPVANDYREGSTSTLTLIDLALNQAASTIASNGFSNIRSISMTTITQSAPHDHQTDIDAAQAMISDAVMELMEREMSREAAGVIRGMHAQMRELVTETLEKSVTGDTSPETRALVEAALNRMANAALHIPVMQAKAHAANGSIQAYRQALETVHGITDPVE